MTADRRPNVYAVSRSLWDDPDFAPEPFTEREAWAWLIGAAAWKAIRARGNAGPVDLQRGEFSFAVRFLAVKWQWSKDRVHRFVNKLQKRDMIRDASRDSSQVYSIKNYNRFQVVGLPARDSDETLSATDVRRDRDSTATAPRQHRDKEETGKTGITGEEEGRGMSACADRSTPRPAVVEIIEPEAGPPRQPDLLEIPRFLDRRGEPPHDPDAKRAAATAMLEQARAEYNAAATDCSWPQCQRLTHTRAASLAKRLIELGGIEGWVHAMGRARESPFLRGETGRTGSHESWRPDFDFFLKPATITKLMEGKYDRVDRPASNGSGHSGGGQLERIAAAAAFAMANGPDRDPPSRDVQEPALAHDDA